MTNLAAGDTSVGSTPSSEPARPAAPARPNLDDIDARDRGGRTHDLGVEAHEQVVEGAPGASAQASDGQALGREHPDEGGQRARLDKRAAKVPQTRSGISPTSGPPMA